MKSTHIFSLPRFVSLLLATLMLGSCVACTASSNPGETTVTEAVDTMTATTPATEAPTDPATEATTPPPETAPETLPETQPQGDPETEPETEEVFEIHVPEGVPADLTNQILGEDNSFDVNYVFGGQTLSDLTGDSGLIFVGGSHFVCDQDGLTALNTCWASVGLGRIMTQPYIASAHLIARENDRTQPAAAAMIGVRCPGGGNLHIDGGLWVMFREDSVYVHFKGGDSYRLADAVPGVTTEGVDVEITDDGSTLTIRANGTLLGTATIAGENITVFDAAGTQIVSKSTEYIAHEADNLGYVRSMLHYANGTIGSLRATAAGENRETYQPIDGTVALREEKVYGFRDLVQYKATTPFRTMEGQLYADASLLATLFGFDCETGDDGASVTLTREGLTLVFQIREDKVTANGQDVAFPTVVREQGVIRLSATWLAAMLGYNATVEADILYIQPSGNTLTEEDMTAMKDRYDLYETVVYNHDDVEADQTGVGKYNAVPPEERLVGIAYTTWHTASRRWGSATWDLPLLGPYLSDDRDIIYQHGLWLAAADVDFVFVDWSNNTCYDPATMRESRADFRMIEEATDLLFEIWSTIPNAPKICIFVGPGHSGIENVNNGNHQKKVDQVYRDYVEKYPDMYFFYEGKPLLICYGATPTQYGATPSWKDDRFTVRWMTGYVGQQGSLFNAKTLAATTYWSWEERGTQTYAVRRADKSVEAVTVSAASRQQGKEGEAGYIPAYGRDNGATLKRQFQRACDLGARFVILVSWNEWTTGEQPSAEISKDLEPSRIHGTFYYDLLCEQIKKFKGKL